MKLAFGETLLPAAKYLPWFAAATTLLLVYRAFATVLLSRNLPQAGLYGYAVGALLSVVASYPAISWWGLAGAVTLVVVNNLILVSCAVVIFWRRPSDLASSIPSAVS